MALDLLRKPGRTWYWQGRFCQLCSIRPVCAAGEISGEDRNAGRADVEEAIEEEKQIPVDICNHALW